MSTFIKMECGGCDAKHEVRVSRTFQSFSGRGYGFGTYHYPTIEQAVEPSGWVWADPYTGCTYCPKCWAEIESNAA